MSTDQRVAQVQAAVPQSVSGQHRAALVAALAAVESRTAFALAAYVSGDTEPLAGLIGPPDSPAAVIVGPVILAAFGACAEALNAAVGDDPSRGYAALVTLQERAAEYAQLTAPSN